MKATRRVLLAASVVVGVATALTVSVVVVRGQGRSNVEPPPMVAPPSAPAPQPPPQPDVTGGFEERRYYRPVFRLGTPYVLSAGNQAGDVAVVFGDVAIDGRVNGDVVAVLGSLRIGSAAVIDGDVVVVGGVAQVDQGATLLGAFRVIGGSVHTPPDFSPMGEHVIIGPPVIGDSLRSIVPWFTRGLLWGRVIVPGLSWMWPIIGLSQQISHVLAAAFPRGVRASADALGKRPVSAFFVGLMVLLLIGPVSTVLAVSVVGLVVVPFLLCALVVGWMVGKVGVSEWIGAGVVHIEDPASRAQMLRAVGIGFVIIIVAYMIPLIGLAAWAIVGLLGLGSATLAFVAALKRERPVPVPPAVSPVAMPQSPVAGPGPAVAPLNVPASAVDARFVDVGGEPPAAAPPLPPPPPATPPVYSSGDLRAYPRATFLDRLAAFALDMILVFIASRLVDFDDDGMFFLVLLAYYAAFIAWKGTTVGGIVCSLRVVRTDGTLPRPVDAVVRTLSSLFSIAALGIGFLWILLDSNRDRQAWHDIIAGTLVVRVPRELPL